MTKSDILKVCLRTQKRSFGVLSLYIILYSSNLKSN